MEREKGRRNVGKWGFPFPNHKPANMRLLRRNLQEKQKQKLKSIYTLYTVDVIDHK